MDFLGDIQPNHGDRTSSTENDVGGFRIIPNVCLCCWGCIAGDKSVSAHKNDFLDILSDFRLKQKC